MQYSVPSLIRIGLFWFRPQGFQGGTVFLRIYSLVCKNIFSRPPSCFLSKRAGHYSSILIQEGILYHESQSAFLVQVHESLSFQPKLLHFCWPYDMSEKMKSMQTLELFAKNRLFSPTYKSGCFSIISSLQCAVL